MFKNSFLYFLGFALLFAGCEKKADNVFEQTTDERLEAVLNAYQQALYSATYGWKVIVYPKGLQSENLEVGGFSYYMRFSNDNRVTMLSDFDITTASTPKESGYRLKAVQRPSIYFDTYSYLHIPADPTASISRSPSSSEGSGWGTDFDFAFTEKTPGDTIRLKGNFNGSDAVMIKATKEEAEAFGSGQLAASLTQLQNLNQIGYFKKLTIGSQQYYININSATKTIAFTRLDAGGNEQTFTSGYYSTLQGINLTQPFDDGTQVIRSINWVTWNAGSTTMTVSVGDNNGTISNAGKPLKVDVEAPRRWWQYAMDKDAYWFTVNGFTINGVPDAYNIRSIPNFYYLIFWPAFGNSGGITYDLLGYVTVSNNALNLDFGSAFAPPTFTPDGRIIFRFLGTLGNVPPDYASVVNNTRITMSSPDGFYLIQTGPLQYDMVSKDGKAWMTWQY